MHYIEPYFNWRNLYVANEDYRSPFYERFNSEVEFTDVIYDYVIHPQWDNIGSPTLFLKVIFCDYEENYAVIELLGEWNDAIHNDIMILKRDIADIMIDEGIDKFILIAENVLNFHSSDDCYYEEWFEDIEDGWICLLNAQEHVLREFQSENIDQYFVLGGSLNDISWRTLQPDVLFQKVEQVVNKRLSI